MFLAWAEAAELGTLGRLEVTVKKNTAKQGIAKKNTPTTVDEYLATLPKDVRDSLQKLRRIIKSTVPEAKERIAYQVPVFSLQRDLVGFSAQRNPQKKHCSFYTMSPPLVKAMKKELQDYEVSGATIHFTPNKPLPASFVKKIVRARVKESSGKGLVRRTED